MAERAGPERIVTERLELTPLARADWEALADRLVLDPAVMRFWHAYAEPRLSDEDRRRMAERDFWAWFERSLESGHVVWAIRRRSSRVRAGAPIGWVGLLAPIGGGHGEPELAYMLAAAVHGRGFATEAARAALEDAWRRHPEVVRVAAIVDAPNIASRRVVAKLGFVVEHGYTGDDGHPYVRYVRDRPRRHGSGGG